MDMLKKVRDFVMDNKVAVVVVLVAVGVAMMMYC